MRFPAVAAIRKDIESDAGPLLPNAIVIAFDDRVRFEATPSSFDHSAYVRSGVLAISVFYGP